MDDKQLDQQIREAMESLDPQPSAEAWSSFEQHLAEEGLTAETHIDEKLIEQLSGFEVASSAGDWDVFSSKLEAAEAADDATFDEDVRHQIEHYEVPYQPETWPVLKEKLALEEARRVRLYTAKILEIACILLLIYTAFNLKLIDRIIPSDRPDVSQKTEIASLINQENVTFQGQNSEKENGQDEDNLLAENLLTRANMQPSNDGLQTNQLAIAEATNVVENKAVEQIAQNIGEKEVANQEALVFDDQNDIGTDHKNYRQNNAAYDSNKLIENDGVRPDNTVNANENSVEGEIFTVEDLTLTEKTIVTGEAIGAEGMAEELQIVEDGQNVEEAQMAEKVESLNLLGALAHPIFNSALHEKLYSGISPLLKNKTRVRFGLRSSADVNILAFPSDNFFSAGNRIEFEEQVLPAMGYGGGMTIGWFGKRFGYETGFLYSSKSFKPGRKIIIGEAFLNSTLDFAGVQIDVLSIPVNVTYQVKPMGKFRIYALGGADLNLITQANYDLNIKYNRPASLSIATSAQFDATVSEAQRVREHILDGAKFSSKSYLTVHTGFGLEQYLNPDISIFAEPTYTYQVPFGILNSRDGKHLQAVSLQLGARMPLK